MTSEVVIALDQGSSSSRALAFDARGRLVAKAQVPVKTSYPRPGWAEHDPLELARSSERALDAVLAELPKKAEVVGVGVACQRSTVVLWDRETGKPLGRAPSWQDGRAADLVAALQGNQAAVHQKTGLYLNPYYSAPKLRWLLESEPEARRLADAGKLLAGPVASWLAWRLTKGEVFAADPTLAQRMLLLDLETLDWDDGLLSLFRVPRAALPKVLPSAGEWGRFTRAGRDLRLLSCVGDQQAAALGLGATEPGSSVANYGTGAFFLHNVGAERRRIPGLLTSVGWQEAGEPAFFLQEGTVHAAGAAFAWLRQAFGLKAADADLDGLCRASTERLFVLPAVGGLGAPRWDYQTKTVVAGLTSRTTPADLVRGTAEAVAFLVADIVDAMRAAGVQPGTVRASGGLSRVRWLMQFQADVLALPVARCRESEATALGAAWLAARAAGAGWADALLRRGADEELKPSIPVDASLRLREAWRKAVAAQQAASRETRLS